MAGEVTICNLALSRIGDKATVASIDPPEGSAQAGHCKDWYPVCRDLVLESHTWGFATARVPLALLTDDSTQPWRYTYGRPADALKIWAIVPPDAPDDYSVGRITGVPFTRVPQDRVMDVGGIYVPQDFSQEVLQNGTRVILAHQPDAIARYTKQINDPTFFPPTVVDCIVWLLASYLAGPVIKGDAGMAVSQRMYQFYLAALAAARSADGNSVQIKPRQVVTWLANR